MDHLQRRPALGAAAARVRSACTISRLRFSISACPMKNSMAPVPGNFL